MEVWTGTASLSAGKLKSETVLIEEWRSGKEVCSEGIKGISTPYKIFLISILKPLSSSRPDITITVDWAYNTKLLPY